MSFFVQAQRCAGFLRRLARGGRLWTSRRLRRCYGPDLVVLVYVLVRTNCRMLRTHCRSTRLNRPATANGGQRLHVACRNGRLIHLQRLEQGVSSAAARGRIYVGRGRRMSRELGSALVGVVSRSKDSPHQPFAVFVGGGSQRGGHPVLEHQVMPPPGDHEQVVRGAPLVVTVHCAPGDAPSRCSAVLHGC